MSFLREPNAEPIPGQRLIEPLGSGGFGEVWKCEAPGGLYELPELDLALESLEESLDSLNRRRGFGRFDGDPSVDEMGALS